MKQKLTPNHNVYNGNFKKNRGGGGYSVMKITQTSTLIHANVLHFLALCPESMPATQETQTVKV